MSATTFSTTICGSPRSKVEGSRADKLAFTFERQGDQHEYAEERKAPEPSILAADT
jgi:hypothetical protein